MSKETVDQCDKVDIKGLIDTLRDGELLLDLYELILEIATKKNKRANNYGYSVDEASETATDFILYLKSNLGVGDIRTVSDLSREYGRWITAQKAPEAHELWTIISEALRYLEKAHKCERDDMWKNHSNSNSTPWFITKYRNCVRNLRQSNAEIKKIPNYSRSKRKADSKNQAKIIPPASAQELVLHVLNAVKAPITMEEIVSIAKQKVLLIQILPPQSNQNNGEDDNESCPANDVADRTTPMLISIQNEIQQRYPLIWDAIGDIHRGKNKSISGHKILCLYFIPTTLFGKKVNMEEFGPTSTVENVNQDIMDVLKQYLSFDAVKQANDDVLQLSLEVSNGIITKLNRKCSEIGYDHAL